VISVRVRRKLKEEVEELGLDVRSIVEEALEKEVAKRRLQRLRQLVNESLEDMKQVAPSDWVEAVREARRER